MKSERPDNEDVGGSGSGGDPNSKSVYLGSPLKENTVWVVGPNDPTDRFSNSTQEIIWHPHGLRTYKSQRKNGRKGYEV